MEEYSCKKFFEKLFRQGQKYAFNVSNEEEYVQWKQKALEELAETLGLNELGSLALEQKEKLKVKELEMVQEKGFIRKKLTIETMPETEMPFYMLVPNECSKAEPRGCMIAVPAHGANKDTVAGVKRDDASRHKIENAPKESYGLEFLKQGYIVLCPDPIGYGERVEKLPMEDAFFSIDKERVSTNSSCKDLAQTAEAFGLSFTAIVIWEMKLLVDFAVSNPLIDSKRIGCAGFSGGGQYSMWLAAFDQRIKIAVISGYVHGYYDSILETHLCPCNYAPGVWKLVDICDILAMIAPRYIYMENGTKDALCGPRGIEDTKQQAEKARKAYGIFHKEENLKQVIFEGTHEWAGLCYDFVKEKL